MQTKRVTTLLILIAALGTATLITEAGQNNKNDRHAEAALQAADNKAFIDGDLKAAIEQYNQIVKRYASSRAVAAKALVRLGEMQEKQRNKEAQKAYEQVIRDYGDQATAVAEARRRLGALAAASPAASARQGLTKLTTGGNWSSVSPDGRYLLGFGAVGGGLKRDLVTGEQRTLREDLPDGFAGEHRVSADGKYVAYGFYPEQTDAVAWELRISTINSGPGAETKVLLRDKKYPYLEPFGWRPDGKEVFAFLEREDEQTEIAAISTSGAVRIIKSMGMEWPELSLSPDGRYIAYGGPALQASARNRDIFVLAADGANETAVVRDASWDETPVWTPDGKGLVFTSDRSGSLGLWLITVSDGKPQGTARLLRNISSEQHPLGFAHDGSYFYGTSSRRLSDVSTVAIDLVAETLAEQKPIERFAGRNSVPAYSPDGRKLAYLSQRSIGGGFQSIVLRTVESGEETEIPTAFTNVRGLTWFPDGQSVLVVSRDSGLRIHRIDLRTGEDLLKDEVGGNFPAASPDGRKLYYVKPGKERAQRIMAYEIDTRRETELYQGFVPQSGGSPRFALSPDGKEIAVALVQKNAPTPADPTGTTTEPAVLRIVPAAGGTPRKLEFQTRELIPIQWSPDGKNILIQRGNGQLWWIPTAGGESKRITINGAIPQIVSMRPDGKEFAFTNSTAGPAPEVWVDPDLLRSRVTNGASSPQNNQFGIYAAQYDPATGKVGGAAQLLVNQAAGMTCAPSWSADGKQLAFFRRRAAPNEGGGNYEWVIRNIESGEETLRGTVNTPCYVSSIWSHGGSGIYYRSSFLGRDGGRLALRDFTSQQQSAPTAQVSGYQSATALSLDDKTFYMTAHDPKTRITSIVAVEIASGRQERIWSASFQTDPDTLIPLRLSLSPDGRTLALVLTDSKKFRLMRVGTDGKGEREIYSVESSSGSTPSRSGLTWTRDGRSILFLDESKSGQRLMRVSADGGKPDFTGLSIGPSDTIIDLSPDGRRLVFFSPQAPTISGANGNR